MVVSLSVATSNSFESSSPSSSTSLTTSSTSSFNSIDQFNENVDSSWSCKTLKESRQLSEEDNSCKIKRKIEESIISMDEKKTTNKDNTLVPRTKIQYESFHRELTILQHDFPHARPRELKRFLASHAGNAHQAALHYEAHIRWKTENLPPNIDILRNSGKLYLDENDQEDNIEFYFYGQDRQDRLLAYCTISVIDETSCNIENVVRKIAYKVEPLVSKLDHSQQSISIILDTRKFQNKSIEYQILRQTLEFFQKHYPELIGLWLIVPMGLIQRCIWSFFSILFFEERQTSKIRLLPDVSSLIHYVDQESLLITYGGKATLFDHCKSE